MSHIISASVAVLFCALASAAGAQVIYEPVQYQYDSGGRAYYYGGSNPQVHRNANQLSHESGFGRSNGWAFHSGSIDTHREVGTEPTRVYSDMIPTRNARVFGYTADDARNAAYANSATYFRKSDVVRLARVAPDGTWVVPANAQSPARGGGTIEIKVVRPATTLPKPILSIPKRLLDKPLFGDRDRVTADAR
jgi:hypothetical protein